VSGLEYRWLSALLGAVQADWLSLAGIPLALLVSVHVLLRKREVGSSIGWIGLAWLSPIIGSVLYFIFGINRVTRKAQRMRDRPVRGARRRPPVAGRDTHLAPLERAAGQLTGRVAESGNALRVLHNGDEAYPLMRAAIEGARHSIALGSYILFDDAAGGPFIDALIAAQGRGVAVRVLIDGIGSGYFRSKAYERLHAAGVPVARFMHSSLPWRMPFLNLRSHKKILVADGRLGFTGGMNISAGNLVATHPPAPIRDTHFQVQGPVVNQLVEAFARDWSFETGETLEGDAWFPEAEEPGDALARVVTSGPDQDIEKIEFLVLQAISCARQSVRIITPYFLPDERLITALALAAMRGVEVDVVIPRDGDHPTVTWAAHANIGPLLAEGCHVWLNPPPFEHTKLMIVDSEWAFIGSANWDMRSFRLNFELNLEVYDSALAQQLEQVVLSRRSHRLLATDLAARSLPFRLRDAATRLMLPYL
jgi:cardiolipin synthase